MIRDSKQIHYRVIDDIHINVVLQRVSCEPTNGICAKNNHHYQNRFSLGGG